MKNKILSKRKRWQDKSSLGGGGREETAKKILQGYLKNKPGLEDYAYHERPNHLSKIYNGQWGIVPDFAIENIKSGKIVFFETKRQGKEGNAHERACKYFAPGLVKKCERIAGVQNPFFFIFMNGLTKDPKKCMEIFGWFDADGYRDHYLLWKNPRSIEVIQDWFETNVRRYLE